MQIIATITVGSGEADKYLEAVLNRIKPLVDTIAITINNVDEKTLDLLTSYGCKIYEDNREWGLNQNLIKQDFYKKIEELSPDWVLPLDADEIFDERLTREDLEEMANNKLYDSYSFYFVQLWDKGYNPSLGFWNVRFHKYLPGNWTNKAMHPGLAPEWAYKTTWYAPFIMIHYGLKDNREVKVARYEKYDPTAKYLSKWFYDQLKNGKAEKLDIKKITKEVVEEVNSYQQRKQRLMNNQNKELKFYYFKRKIDGMILDIPERNYEEMLLKSDEFELVNKEPVVAGNISIKDVVSNVSTTIKNKINEELFICDICGFVAKSVEELKEHKDLHITKAKKIEEAKKIEDKEVKDKVEVEDKDKDKTDNSFVCDICGFVAKNEAGLQSHKRTHKKK